MNHCIECGKPISRGRTKQTDRDYTHCLVCQTKRDLQTFRYKSAVARLRERVKQLERTT